MQATLVKPTLLNEREAAKFIGVQPGTLTVWRCRGTYPLPYVKIGRLVRYNVEDLVAWIESRTIRQTEEVE